MVVIDARDMIFGRVASRVAKMLIRGEEVIIVNAERFILNGNPDYIISKFKMRRSWRNKANPEHSPHYPRVPHLLVRRMIRGMLPRKKFIGRQAFRRLKVLLGNPQGLQGLRFEDAEMKDFGKPHIYIEDLCRRLGWNHG
ncbi:MAG: 50S ribosomal protein L13 [Candidatus Micrarchaeota archaeon]|nr:50S ribosomal protein L13 [Candidatus Micrarchaeota archaeon]MCX8154287.1 50S ribosomal protein L13 [Candidatus Micrarchaeota archaeon]